MQEEKCCVVSSDKPLDENYWNQQYMANATGWDLGEVAPATKEYIDALPSKDIHILIPGCGNAHEAVYLLKQGFTNVTVIDIAPVLVNKLKQKFSGAKGITIIHGDFFTHSKKYDLIFEQTFFCALPPFMRQQYVFQMHFLLKTGGILAGLLFDRDFEVGPPFGGSQPEYENLFRGSFIFRQFSECQNSIEKRFGSELFVEFEKKEEHTAQLFAISGISCGNCSTTITEKILRLDGVGNCSISTNFKELLLVSKQKIPLEALKHLLSYDKEYQIELIK